MADTSRRGRVRIIGGEWRGRRLPIPEAPASEVRPSPDRLRETLFNWLTPVISGARCLDVFAGSGALGLEALSRGAREVVFVDRARPIVQSIDKHLATLGAVARGRTVQAEAPAFLRTDCGAFDVVFLDPPFHAALLLPCLRALRAHLTPGHRVYVEHGQRDAPAWPDATAVLNTARAGRVNGALLRLDSR